MMLKFLFKYMFSFWLEEPKQGIILEFMSDIRSDLESASIADIASTVSFLSRISIVSAYTERLCTLDQLQLRVIGFDLLVNKLKEDVKLLNEDVINNIIKITCMVCSPTKNNWMPFIKQLYENYHGTVIPNKFSEYNIIFIYSHGALPIIELVDYGLLYTKNLFHNLAKLTNTSFSSHIFHTLQKAEDVQKLLSTKDLSKKTIFILDDHGTIDSNDNLHKMFRGNTKDFVSELIQGIAVSGLTHQTEILTFACYGNKLVQELSDSKHQPTNVTVGALGDKLVFFHYVFNAILLMFMQSAMNEQFTIDDFSASYEFFILQLDRPEKLREDREVLLKTYNFVKIDLANDDYYEWSSCYANEDTTVNDQLSVIGMV